jgi:hypothetical protein
LPRSLVMSKESYYVCTVTSTIPASAPVVIHVRIEVVESRIPQLRSVLLHVLRSTSKYSLPGAVAAAADNCAVYFRCGLEINGLSVHRVVKDTPRTSVAVVYGVRGIASLYLRGNTTSHSGNRASPLRSW